MFAHLLGREVNEPLPELRITLDCGIVDQPFLALPVKGGDRCGPVFRRADSPLGYGWHGGCLAAWSKAWHLGRHFQPFGEHLAIRKPDGLPAADLRFRTPTAERGDDQADPPVAGEPGAGRPRPQILLAGDAVSVGFEMPAAQQGVAMLPLRPLQLFVAQINARASGVAVAARNSRLEDVVARATQQPAAALHVADVLQCPGDVGADRLGYPVAQADRLDGLELLVQRR